ncbi:MAG: beta-ketoacyl-[acyl-carrier-protein] synthase II, partial [Acidimicrobiia bacterium]|nr:beta-ketoacyl-[acyl-carrier-protein] synthase II [Acidimicrobiia bacterium]
MRRVVVTGLGAVTPVGTGVDEVWDNLVSGVSGIGEISLFDASGLPTTIAAEVKDFDPEVTIPRKEARRLDRNAQLFWVATGQALEDSGISYEEGDPAADRAGVVVG